MPIAIRPVRADDWREMKRLRLLALATDRLAFGATLEQEGAFADQVWIDRARASAAGRDVTTFVAEDEAGQLVGMMGAHIGADALTELGSAQRSRRGRSQEPFQDSCLIGARLFGTWVDPRVRGAGIGGRLLDAVLGWIAGVAPAAVVGLCVNPTFEAAVRLYQSRGFQRAGCSSPSPFAHAPDACADEMVLPRAR